MKNTGLIKYKNNIFTRLINFIFRRNNKKEQLQNNVLINDNQKDDIIDRLKIEIEEKNYIPQEFEKSLKEVSIILTGFDPQIVKKIPQSFVGFIEKHKNNDYEPNINPLKRLDSQELLKTTKIIISIIYRKYIQE